MRFNVRDNNRSDLTAINVFVFAIGPARGFFGVFWVADKACLRLRLRLLAFLEACVAIGIACVVEMKKGEGK